MKLIKMYKVIVLLIFLCLKTLAQQEPLYSLYMYDKMLINPAFTGSSNWAVGTIKYRNQFTGFKSNPNTQTLNFHTPIQTKHVGVGFKIISDKIAIVNTMNTAVDFSYHMNFARGKLSFGLEAGVISRKTDFQKVITSSLGDVALTDLNKKTISPDAAWGLFYQRHEFYAGFSQYHLLAHNDQKGAFSHNYYFITGKVFDISKKWSVEPNTLIKIQPKNKIQIDLNAILSYDDKASVGVQYRPGSNVNATFKFSITPNLKVAYSYDNTLSKLSNYTSGSHEILISYGIKLPPPPTRKEIHPRYYF